MKTKTNVAPLFNISNYLYTTSTGVSTTTADSDYVIYGFEVVVFHRRRRREGHASSSARDTHTHHEEDGGGAGVDDDCVCTAFIFCSALDSSCVA